MINKFFYELLHLETELYIPPPLFFTVNRLKNDNNVSIAITEKESIRIEGSKENVAQVRKVSIFCIEEKFCYAD